MSRSLRLRNDASFQKVLCISIEDLWRFKFHEVDPGLQSTIRKHLHEHQCPACNYYFAICTEEDHRYFPTSLSRSDQSLCDKFLHDRMIAASKTVPFVLEEGQIWTTLSQVRNSNGRIVATAPASIPVLILSGGNGRRKLDTLIEVIPLSLDTDFAVKGHDTILWKKDTSLAYHVLLEHWNKKTMLAGNLGFYRATLPPEVFSEALNCQANYESDSDLQAIPFDDDIVIWRKMEQEITQHLTIPNSSNSAAK